MPKLRLAACVLALALGIQADPVLAQATKRFDVAVADASSALKLAAVQGDFEILIPPKLVEGKRANSVKGEMPAQKALEQLLQGTGLTARRVNGKSFVVEETGKGADGKQGAATNPIQLAQAQTPAAGASDAVRTESGASKEGKLERIEVTGSRIGQVEAEGLSPVITITQEEIKRSGAANLNQLLRRLPQASIAQDESLASALLGGTTIRLRGLPAGTTLVLLNGRRLVASGVQTGSYFDLRNIPISAIEKIEVLTDTASAIYGADALAGVVNVILKKGKDDYSVDFRHGAATQGGLDDSRFSLTGGKQGRFQVTWGGDFYRSSILRNDERARTSDFDFRPYGGLDRRTTASNPGTIYALPGTGNLPGLNSTFAAVPAGSTGVGLTPSNFLPTAGLRNLGSQFYVASNVPGSRTSSAFLNTGYEVSNELSVGAELLYSTTDLRVPNDYRALTGGAAGSFQVPASNPFNPFGRAVGVDYLLTGVGPRLQVADTDFMRGLLSSRWEFNKNWSWEFALWATRDKTFSQTENVADFGLVRAALNRTDPSLALNVFGTGPGASDEVLRSLIGPPVNVFNIGASARQVESQIRGGIGGLPAGTVELAFGAEARRELVTSDVANAVNAKRTVHAYYAEAMVPLVNAAMRVPMMERVSITLAGRQDRYSDFGSSFNPQYGLKWTINPSVLVRASAGDGFKAPTLQQLFVGSSSFSSPIVDRRRNNESYTVLAATGGNLQLEPEEGRSRNIGVVLSPGPGANVSLDWWQIEQSQRVVNGLLPELIISNEAFFQSRVQRALPSAADIAAGLPGRVTSVDSSAANLGSLDASGIDLRGTQSLALMGGTLALSLGATYVLRFDAQVRPDAPIEDRRGIASTDAFAPKLKSTVGGFWQGARFGGGATVRYIASYRDYPGLSAARNVASQTLIDLQGTYLMRGADLRLSGQLKEIKVGLGVTNLLDREPPFANTSRGYDFLQTNVIGRFVYLTVEASF